MVVCPVVCRDCAALTSDGGWQGAASDCDHSVPSPNGLSSGWEMALISFEGFGLRYLLALFDSCFGGLTNFLVFGRRPLAGLLWVITGFFDRKVLVSQLRLLAQPGRALQIGMAALRMSKAHESPDEILCCRDSLRGRLVVIGMPLLFCRRTLRSGRQLA